MSKLFFMWQNNLRQSVYFLIYQNLVNPEFNDIEENLDKLRILYGFELDPLSVHYLEKFVENKDKYTSILVGNFSDWQKTYNLVKAIVFTFVLEQLDFEVETDLEVIKGVKKTGLKKDIVDIENINLELKKDNKKLLSSYIALAQDFTSNENVKLVHAVLAKLLSKTDFEQTEEKSKNSLKPTKAVSKIDVKVDPKIAQKISTKKTKSKTEIEKTEAENSDYVEKVIVDKPELPAVKKSDIKKPRRLERIKTAPKLKSSTKTKFQNKPQIGADGKSLNNSKTKTKFEKGVGSGTKPFFSKDSNNTSATTTFGSKNKPYSK